MNYFLCALLGYVLGSSNMAYYLGRLRGVDVRSIGSKNLGASNAMVLMGWKAGVLTAVHDIAKSALAVYLARLFFPQLALAGAVAGVFCVVGHIFPFYLRFRGGKGFAAYLGMVAVLDPGFCLHLCLGIVVITLVTDYIALATSATVVSYPIYVGITRGGVFTALLIALMLVVLYKHRDNFVRIHRGEEIGLRAANRGDNRIK